VKLRAVIVTGLTLAAGLSLVEARTATALPAAPASSVASGVTAAGLAYTLATPTAYTAAAALQVKGRAPTTGYSRTAFGQAWADTDRNGCDTRNDVLRRDLTRDVIRAGTNGCVLLRGTLLDPYTNTTIAFVRGPQSSAVQIDHVVALSDAWQKGAQQWTTSKRTAFANDSLNLLAVDGPTNQRKGAGDAATWLPPNRAYRCAFVARQVAVKRKYGAWVTAAERSAMLRVLGTCRSQRLPVAVAFRLGATTTTTAPLPIAPPSSTTDPRFSTCSEAKSRGYGPYYRSRDPEYLWYRDGDSDGIACE
jgi:hypothetical protein